MLSLKDKRVREAIEDYRRKVWEDPTLRLREARRIIDQVASECLLYPEPHQAIALLNEDEQKRLYDLLKGDEGWAGVTS